MMKSMRELRREAYGEDIARIEETLGIPPLPEPPTETEDK